MAAGTKYNLTPEYKPEEFYRVETGVRKSGPWKLDITNLVVGSTLPVFTPVQADLKKRTLVPVRNVRVIEAYATGETALSIKIAKDSLAYVGMFIGSGKKGAEVSLLWAYGVSPKIYAEKVSKNDPCKHMWIIPTKSLDWILKYTWKMTKRSITEQQTIPAARHRLKSQQAKAKFLSNF